jgi:hypothetical protein
MPYTTFRPEPPTISYISRECETLVVQCNPTSDGGAPILSYALYYYIANTDAANFRNTDAANFRNTNSGFSNEEVMSYDTNQELTPDFNGNRFNSRQFRVPVIDGRTYGF